MGIHSTEVELKLNFSKWCSFPWSSSSSPWPPRSTASLPQSVLMDPPPFANVETETHPTSPPPPPVTSRRASPSVSAQEVGALLQSTSNQGQRDLAVLAGLPALTKPLLSVSNAPEEAAPPQRQGAIRNVPPAPSSVRMALHSCVW